MSATWDTLTHENSGPCRVYRNVVRFAPCHAEKELCRSVSKISTSRKCALLGSGDIWFPECSDFAYGAHYHLCNQRFEVGVGAHIQVPLPKITFLRTACTTCLSAQQHKNLSRCTPGEYALVYLSLAKMGGNIPRGRPNCGSLQFSQVPLQQQASVASAVLWKGDLIPS